MNCQLSNKKYLMVHRVIAITWLGYPKSPIHQVNHKNGNKLDNTVDNLEWVTPSQNIQHMIKNGKHDEHRKHMSKISTGAGNPKAKLNDVLVLEILNLKGSGVTQLSVANRFGVSTATIYQIWKRKTWIHLHPIK